MSAHASIGDRGHLLFSLCANLLPLRPEHVGQSDDCVGGRRVEVELDAFDVAPAEVK